jgi:hypothetical protein
MVTMEGTSGGEQAPVLIEQLETEALARARQRHRRSADFEVRDIVVPFLAGVAVIVQFTKPDGDTGKDFFYFGPGGETAELDNMEELARFVHEWSWEAIRSQLAALRPEVEASAPSPTRDAVVAEIDAAERAADGGDRWGFLKHLESAVRVGKDVVEIAQKLGPAAALVAPLLQALAR